MQMTMIEALNSALTLELERDKRVVVFGQDIGANGGVFRVTEHLQQRFGPERVFDTPLSESAIIGSAVGMSVVWATPDCRDTVCWFSLCLYEPVGDAGGTYAFSQRGSLYLSDGGACALWWWGAHTRDALRQP